MWERGDVSLSGLNEVIGSLQTFVDALDSSDGTEKRYECLLLKQIAQLSLYEQRQIVKVMAKLLVRRGHFESGAVGDQVLEVLTAPAADGPTTERQARVLTSLLSRLSRRDPVPETFSNPESAETAFNTGVPSEGDRVSMAVRFLEANASRPMSLDRVAAHVGWSRWHCARVFKRHTGYGIAEFARRIRVSRARRLLADRTLTIKEVAAAAGFTHPSDLTRCFLRAYGISPSRFRKFQPVAGSS